ncbi:hypothetical protein ACJRO7_018020 [Eucalyptus globulus]|uniref:PPM-type phosphatase domain-containing protein n=1 Tax=Eucalyptus globulus TaxID=34317 RepID=A0ABD3KS78_EUCGL
MLSTKQKTKLSMCSDEGGESEWRKVMEASCGKMDEEVGGNGVDASMRMAGSTAMVAVVGKEEVVVANCRDSRAVLCRGDVAVPLSLDHKVSSRSMFVHFRNYHLKPHVIAEPRVTVSKRTELDNFLVIASDGLWDALSNEIACQVMRRHLDRHIKRRFPEGLRGSNIAEAAVVLAELAMARGSQDNISVIVVKLKKPNSKSP